MPSAEPIARVACPEMLLNVNGMVKIWDFCGKKIWSGGRKSRKCSHVFLLGSFFFFKGRFSQDQRELGPNWVFLTQELVSFSVFKAHLAQVGSFRWLSYFPFLAAWLFVVTQNFPVTEVQSWISRGSGKTPKMWFFNPRQIIWHLGHRWGNSTKLMTLGVACGHFIIYHAMTRALSDRETYTTPSFFLPCFIHFVETSQ